MNIQRKLKFKVVITLHKLEIESTAPAAEIILGIRLGGQEVRSRRFKSRDKVFVLQESLVINTDLYMGSDGKYLSKAGKIVCCVVDGGNVIKVAGIEIDLARSLRLPPKIECGRFCGKRMKGLLLYEISFKQVGEEVMEESESTIKEQNLFSNEEIEGNSERRESEKMGIIDKDEESGVKLKSSLSVQSFHSQSQGNDLKGEPQNEIGNEGSERRSERSETPVFEPDIHPSCNTVKKSFQESDGLVTRLQQTNSELQRDLEITRKELQTLKEYSSLQEKASSKSIYTSRDLDIENQQLKTLAIRMEAELANKGLLVTSLKAELSKSQKENRRMEKLLGKNESFFQNWNSKHNETLHSGMAKTKEFHSLLLKQIRSVSNEVLEAFKVKEEILEGDDEGLGLAQLSNHLSRAKNRLSEIEGWLEGDEQREVKQEKSKNLTEEMYKRKWQEAENEIIRMKTRMTSLVNAAYELGNEEFLEYVRSQVTL